MNKLKLNVVMILLLLSSLPGMAQGSDKITVPLSEPSKQAWLDVSIKYGSITVKGTNRSDILVSYTIPEGKKNPENSEGKYEGLKRIDAASASLRIQEYKNKVEVNSTSWNQKINIVIEVPIKTSLKVDTYNGGDINIDNVEGEFELENYNGEIIATNVSGPVLANTYNGKIKVVFSNFKAGMPMSFSTYNGDIDLTLPSDFKGNLKLKTSRGEIYSGFDMQVQPVEPVRKTSENGNKIEIDSWVYSKVNGGGAELTLSTHNGDILLRKK